MIRSLVRVAYGAGAYVLAMTAMVAVPINGAHAAAPPFPVKTVTIAARFQAVSAVVTDLFGQSGLSVKVSSAVTGKLNGTFVGNPAQIWTQLARAFNLVAYYESGVVRVYSATEITTRSIAAASPAAVVREAQKMRITDASNMVTAGSNTVSATGVPEFLTRIAQLSASVAPAAQPATAAVAVKATTPASAAIVSPLLDAPGAISTVATLPVRSRVVVQATTRSPYELRIFYLRYARADDTIQKSYDRTLVIPGVASILRGMMGDGRASNTVSSSGKNYEVTRQSATRLGGRGLDSVDPDASQRRLDDGYGSGGGVTVQEIAPRDVNGPRIEVDPTNNAVLVRDRPESMTVYEDIIKGLDIEPLGVEIEAMIIELNTDRLKELGIDFNIRDNGLTALFGGQSQNPQNGQSAPNLVGNYLTGALNGFQVRITALEKSGILRVVQKPRLSTLNNIPAEFNNLTEISTKVPGDRNVDLFKNYSGMFMRINPSVVFDGGELRTRLQIDISDGTFNGFGPDGGPIIRKAGVNTNAIVKQGEAVMIGGMTIDTEFDYRSKVPVLGDVPVLGQAFRKRNKGAQHFERLFLIAPRILSQGTKSVSASANAGPAPIPLEQLEALAKGKKVRETRREGQR
jgi:type III secretion protein C